MDYYDEDIRPRFQLQSNSTIPQQDEERQIEIDKKHAAICIAIGTLIFSYGCILHGIWQVLIAWIGLSLALGPFAPASLTGGDIRVGVGELLVDAEPAEDDPKPEIEKKFHRGKTRRSVNNNAGENFNANDSGSNLLPEAANHQVKEDSLGQNKESWEAVVCNGNHEEWTLEELELLKKQLIKHPHGKPGRWELISEAFRGTRTLDAVIKKTKSLGVKKPVDEDSYAKFLAQRKILDRPVDSQASERSNGEESAGEQNLEAEDKCTKLGWSSTEDRALLNALKAFPKETALRWEKIAAAVPGLGTIEKHGIPARMRTSTWYLTLAFTAKSIDSQLRWLIKTCKQTWLKVFCDQLFL